MKIGIDLSGPKNARWYEYAIRFLFGGLATLATGTIAKKFGPEIGGLFLAFPAIFPASATLVEAHERKKKRDAGVHGDKLARNAAGVEAAGAALGSIGLIGFAITVIWFLPAHSPWAVLPGAAAVWFATSFLVWKVREAVF
ncbi:MAG: hypothetical protein JWM69_1198 [Candidatus Binatus sp.]|nr:hypothetical protein [Candidatus Binatus sp.]